MQNLTLFRAQTLKASRALLKHLAAENESANGKPNLLAGADAAVPIWLILTTKKYISDTKKLKPTPIVLPHPLNTPANTTACLIVKDPQRHFKDLVEAAGLQNTVTKVISVGKLQAKFKTFEQRRALMEAHDVFLADDRVVTMLPKTLGATFYKKTSKIPIPIDLAGSDSPALLTKKINKAFSSTYLHLAASATTSIRVALSNMSAEDTAENIEKVVKELTEKRVPGGWRNIRSLHIKSPESASLPIWLAQDVYGEGDVLKPEEEKERQEAIAKAAAERKERKQKKLAEKKRKLSETKVEDETPKKAKTEEVKPTKEAEESSDEENEDDNGMEIGVPSEVEESDEEEEEEEEAKEPTPEPVKPAKAEKQKKKKVDVLKAVKSSKVEKPSKKGKDAGKKKSKAKL